MTLWRLSCLIISLVSFVSVSKATLGLINSLYGGNWRELSITLPIPDPLHPTNILFSFNGVPLTRTKATREKWTILPGSDCQNNGAYNGFRFIPPLAPSVVALYDSNGVVAGFQVLADKQKLLSSGRNNYQFDSETMIQTESITINGVTKDYYVLTAYFVDPTTICTSMKTEEGALYFGYGSELYFQNGPTPATLIQIPKNRIQAAAQGWSNNRCLPLNGYHNFYMTDQWQSSQCNTIRPAWLLYDKRDNLGGFGFTLPGNDDSPRFQHPPGLVVAFVLNEPGNTCAKQIADGIKFTNINVYLNSHLRTVGACL